MARPPKNHASTPPSSDISASASNSIPNCLRTGVTTRSRSTLNTTKKGEFSMRPLGAWA
jgi:hypothetical protein